MTKFPVIINDVDVRDCDFYSDESYIDCRRICLAYACLCELKQNCYFKQLQQLKKANND